MRTSDPKFARLTASRPRPRPRRVDSLAPSEMGALQGKFERLVAKGLCPFEAAERCGFVVEAHGDIPSV